MSLTKKYTVFISSTYEDLKTERETIVRACLEMGHIPIGMEMFSAADSTQWAVIQRTIDACDYYAVLIARRYGSTIQSENGISYTEKEYDYAISRNIPVLGFVLDQGANWPDTKRDSSPMSIERLNQFVGKVRSKVISFWKTPEDLAGKFAIALGKALESHPRPGWIPSHTAASPVVANELGRLSEENSQMRAELANVRAVRTEDSDLYELSRQLSIVPSSTTDQESSLNAFIRTFKKFGPQTGTNLSNYEKAPQEDIDVWVSWNLLEVKQSPHSRYMALSPVGVQLIKYMRRQHLLAKHTRA